jgi:hypothetical protein
VDDNVSFEISFNNADDREANQFARDLAAAIRREARGATVRQKTTTETSQDMGTILSVVVSSAALTAVATGIQNWLSQRTKASLILTRLGAEAVNIDSKDAAKMFEVWVKSKGLKQ